MIYNNYNYIINIIILITNNDSTDGGGGLQPIDHRKQNSHR
jgi:hypothetical protein